MTAESIFLKRVSRGLIIASAMGVAVEALTSTSPSSLILRNSIPEMPRLVTTSERLLTAVVPQRPIPHTRDTQDLSAPRCRRARDAALLDTLPCNPSCVAMFCFPSFLFARETHVFPLDRYTHGIRVFLAKYLFTVSRRKDARPFSA